MRRLEKGARRAPPGKANFGGLRAGLCRTTPAAAVPLSPELAAPCREGLSSAVSGCPAGESGRAPGQSPPPPPVAGRGRVGMRRKQRHPAEAQISHWNVYFYIGLGGKINLWAGRALSCGVMAALGALSLCTPLFIRTHRHKREKTTYTACSGAFWKGRVLASN